MIGVGLWLRLNANPVGATIAMGLGFALLGLAFANHVPSLGHLAQPTSAVVTALISRKTKSEVSIRTADGGVGLVSVLNIQSCRIGSSVMVMKRKILFGYICVATVDPACAPE